MAWAAVDWNAAGAVESASRQLAAALGASAEEREAALRELAHRAWDDYGRLPWGQVLAGALTGLPPSVRADVLERLVSWLMLGEEERSVAFGAAVLLGVWLRRGAEGAEREAILSALEHALDSTPCPEVREHAAAVLAAQAPERVRGRDEPLFLRAWRAVGDLDFPSLLRQVTGAYPIERAAAILAEWLRGYGELLPWLRAQVVEFLREEPGVGLRILLHWLGDRGPAGVLAEGALHLEDVQRALDAAGREEAKELAGLVSGLDVRRCGPVLRSSAAIREAFAGSLAAAPLLAARGGVRVDEETRLRWAGWLLEYVASGDRERPAWLQEAVSNPDIAAHEVLRCAWSGHGLPVDVEQVAAACGVYVREDPDAPCEGALVVLPSGSCGLIVYRSGGVSRRRQRITLAHELGHFVLHAGGGASTAAWFVDDIDAGGPERERQADAFAVALLMPPREAARFVQRLPGDLDWDALEEMSDAFDVSLEAAARRAVALHRGEVFLAVSREGRLVYWQASAPARERGWFREPGSPVPPEVAALGPGERLVRVVPADAWLERWQGEERMVERSLGTGRGTVYTLLVPEGEG